jgi:hypothetical protein
MPSRRITCVAAGLLEHALISMEPVVLLDKPAETSRHYSRPSAVFAADRTRWSPLSTSSRMFAADFSM